MNDYKDKILFSSKRNLFFSDLLSICTFSLPLALFFGKFMLSAAYLQGGHT